MYNTNQKMKKIFKHISIKSKHFVYLTLIPLGFNYSQNTNSLEIEKLKKKYDQLTKQSSNQNINDDFNQDIEIGSPTKVKIAPPLESSMSDLDLSSNKLEHYGYSFFSRRDTIAFMENLSVPVDYILGPGDELVISIWGETQIRQNYTINRDGKIYDDKVGLLFLSGKNLKEAKDYLKSQFGNIYSTLNGKRPTSFFDISIGELNSINVNFVGNVKFPGIYPLHPFSSVINGLIHAGGIDTTGSLRNIYIKRKDSRIDVDLYDFLISGGISNELILKDQDIVIVNPRKSRVVIDSAVVNPGIYEAKESETIYDLISHSGGLSQNASNEIGIKRILPLNERQNGNNYEATFVSALKLKDFSSNLVTEIVAYPINNENLFVEIIGQIKSPGRYNFKEGVSLSDILKISGGFNDTTFIKSVFLDKGQIIRRSPLNRYGEVITFNLRNLLNEKDDIQLQNLDKIIVHSNLNYFEKKPVQIIGEVGVPGSYPVLKDGESLRTFINRAGGFTEKSFIEGIKIYRDSLSLAWNSLSVKMMPGDSVVIIQKPGTVLVSGEVYNPGLIEYDNQKSLKNYINLAGGFTKIGDKKDIIVIYPNGNVVPTSLLFSKKIMEGSTIIVNQKPPTDPFNVTEFANTALSIVSSFLTIAVLVKQI